MDQACRWRRFGFVFAGDEQSPQQFADRRFRNGVDEDVAARALEIGKPGGAAELIEFAFADRRAALHKSRDDLAPLLVGKPTTATSATAGCSDRQLSISTGETFSPPVMIMSSTRPVTNRSPSAIDKAGIAGEIPALAQRLGVRIGPPPIAFERFIAGKQRDDLAFLVDCRESSAVERRRA